MTGLAIVHVHQQARGKPLSGTETASVSLFTPEFFQDPHSVQTALRAEAPSRPMVTVWVITLYEQTLATYERVLGSAHPTTEIVRDNLAAARHGDGV
jgi:hypothetical protein